MTLRACVLLPAILVLIHATAYEARADAAFAVTTSNALIAFDTAAPGTLALSTAITGLQGGENILGIDFRPSTRELYGLGSTGRLYTINTITGVATQVGSGTFALTGTNFGFDFNPVVDRIRVVSDADVNFRLNPDTGAVFPDTNLAYAAADVSFGVNPNVTAAAYTNNVSGASTTTLYGIDSTLSNVVRIGGPDGVPSPNTGQLTTIGTTTGVAATLIGFDISSSGTGFATFSNGEASQLSTVNLSTGFTALVGLIGGGEVAVRALAILPEANCSSPDVFGVTTANTLIRFSSSVPGVILASTPITGLQGGENILGIDFRPANGQLYGLGSTGRLYTINITTGAATQVGAGTFALGGTSFGFDFNPVVDRIRVVSDTDENFRLNPDTGALAGTDTNLTYAVGDPNFGVNPNVTAAAYSNNVGGALSTTLYGIDSTLSTLVRIGGPAGVPSPNTGQLTTIGTTGVMATLIGFDIASSGTAFVTFSNGGASQLSTVNLSTGFSALVGLIGNGTLAVRAVAVNVVNCPGCPAHTVHGHLPAPPTHSGATHEHHGEHGHQSAAGCPPHAPGHSPGLTLDEPEVLALVTAEGAISDNGLARDVPGVRVRPAQQGEVLQLFVAAAELGDEFPVVRIGELAAKVLFSGPAPGVNGVWQLNVQVPREAPRGVSQHVTVLYRGREWPSVDVSVE